MGTRDLPDMYVQSPRAEGIHIRQITRANVTKGIFLIFMPKGMGIYIRKIPIALVITNTYHLGQSNKIAQT